MPYENGISNLPENPYLFKCNYVILWDGGDGMSQPVSYGIYLCRIKAGEFRELKKLVLVR